MKYKLIECIKPELINNKLYNFKEKHWFRIAEVVEYKSYLHFDKMIRDEILIDSDNNVYVYRDADVYTECLLCIDEVSKLYDDTQNKVFKDEEYILKLEDYYSIIILKMRKYDRNRIIDVLLDEDQKYYDQLIQCC